MASKYSLSPAMGLAPRSIITVDITSIVFVLSFFDLVDWREFDHIDGI